MCWPTIDSGMPISSTAVARRCQTAGCGFLDRFLAAVFRVSMRRARSRRAGAAEEQPLLPPRLSSKAARSSPSGRVERVSSEASNIQRSSRTSSARYSQRSWVAASSRRLSPAGAGDAHQVARAGVPLVGAAIDEWHARPAPRG
jgi:hypothetical protein